MIRNELFINSMKKFIYGRSEKYKFNGNRLLFKTGSRPVRRKYINSPDDVVRNDVLQIEFFEKNSVQEMCFGILVRISDTTVFLRHP